MPWESDAGYGPWNTNIDESIYPGGNLCAYVGGRGVSFNAPTNYMINDIWAGDFATDIRNSKANIRREFVCIDTKHSKYGQIVTADMLDESNMDHYYPVWTKFAPVDDWGYEDLVYGGNRTNTFRDEYACRLAETYLMCSEAYFHRDGGDSPQAIEYYNKTWERAGNTHENGPLTLNMLLDEYARELHFEGVRWSLLKRLGILGERVRQHGGDLMLEDPYLDKDYA